MGVEYITHVWNNETDVKSARLLLLLAYADYADSDGGSFAGTAKLASRIRGSESGVRSLKSDLIKAHKIIVIPRGGKKLASGQSTDRVIVVAPGINCTNYDDLCEKHNISPVEYVPLLEDNRGGNNPDGKKKDRLKSGGLKDQLNSGGQGGLNSTGQDRLNSGGNPSYDPSGDPLDKDYAAAKANGANGKTPSVKTLTDYQQFTQKLADICGEDMAIKSIAKKVGVNAAELWNAGYKIPDLEIFSKWWYINDWRGKKRQRPNLTNVKGLIKQATHIKAPDPIQTNPAQNGSIFPPGLKPKHLMEKEKEHG